MCGGFDACIWLHFEGRNSSGFAAAHLPGSPCSIRSDLSVDATRRCSIKCICVTCCCSLPLSAADSAMKYNGQTQNSQHMPFTWWQVLGVELISFIDFIHQAYVNSTPGTYPLYPLYKKLLVRHWGHILTFSTTSLLHMLREGPAGPAVLAVLKNCGPSCAVKVLHLGKAF